MEKGEVRKLIWVGVFAVAMAFVEAMIVYYLRKLYYPNNILFPLNTGMPSEVLALEWVREACTIIMLLGIAVLAGKKFQEKFAYFIYSFAVWDIFYYIWLKVSLNWPASLMDWDVLFLIPVTWVSPVLAPVLVSLTMIALAILILKFPKEKINRREWTLLIFACFLVYLSFIWDYSQLILKKGFLAKFAELAIDPALITEVAQYTPTFYHWELLLFGEFMAILALYLFYNRAKKHS